MLRYFILHEKKNEGAYFDPKLFHFTRKTNEGAYFDPMLCYFILHEKQMKEHILTLSSVPKKWNTVKKAFI